MGIRMILVALGIALAVSALPARAGLISSVVAFGDSLIDAGNVDAMPVRPPQPPSPYVGGRYTNGPTPTEVLSARLGVPLISYAIGGAQSGVGNIDVDPPAGSPTDYCSNALVDPSAFCTGVRSQVAQYLSTTQGQADAAALYVVMGGSNDFLALPSDADALDFLEVAGAVIANLVTTVGDLHGAGARQFLLPLLPDIGAAPAVQSQAVTALMSQVNGLLLQAYGQLLAGISQVDPNVQFTLFDTFSAQQALMPLYANSTTACLQPDPNSGFSECADPASHFFWDDLHPTADVSARLGDQLVALVVPEPGMLALLAVAIPLLGLRRRAAASRV